MKYTWVKIGVDYYLIILEEQDEVASYAILYKHDIYRVIAKMKKKNNANKQPDYKWEQFKTY